MSSRIYADHNASSPATTDHWREVAQIMADAEANPSSIHSAGRAARHVLENARHQVATTLGTSDRSIIFTSGATESNNLVIHALAFANELPIHVVLTEGEHPSVRNPLLRLEKLGKCVLHWARLTSEGCVDQDHLFSLIDQSTALVCLIQTNNETGVINPLEIICPNIRERAPSCHIHVDAVQSLGKINLAMQTKDLFDTASYSAHKIAGFKGIGCLQRREGLTLSPLTLGGHQELGLRPGTHHTAGAVSFGLRCAYLTAHPDWLVEAKVQGERLSRELVKIPNIVLHSQMEQNPYTVNFHIPGVEAEELMVNFDLAGICVSVGSACGSGNPQPSATLKSMGCSDYEAIHSIRVSFGEGSSSNDADAILTIIEQVIKRQNR